MFYFDNFYGKKILKSDLLKSVQHFFSTRENLFDNEQRIDFIQKKIQPAKLFSPTQIHSDIVTIIDNNETSIECDGLITAEQNKGILLKFADCTPIIFYDEKLSIIAVTHAGWRGTAQKIGVKTVEKMKEVYSSEPKDIVAVIGPAISLCCYTVGEDVIEKLSLTVSDTTGLINQNRVDLKGFNARQLQEIGIRQIDVCPYCTCCDNDLFYSYRKENGTPNRHFAFCML